MKTSNSDSGIANTPITLVIPAFNEEARVINSLVMIEKHMGTMLFDWDVLIINDGSTDNTKNILEEWI